jgi:hypothetical protein
MDERLPVHAEGSTVQDDDSAWPHPCHCQHVAAWLTTIVERLDFVADRDERETRERRDRQDKAEHDKAEAARAEDKHGKGKPAERGGLRDKLSRP